MHMTSEERIEYAKSLPESSLVFGPGTSQMLERSELELDFCAEHTYPDTKMNLFSKKWNRIFTKEKVWPAPAPGLIEEMEDTTSANTLKELPYTLTASVGMSLVVNASARAGVYLKAELTTWCGIPYSIHVHTLGAEATIQVDVTATLTGTVNYKHTFKGWGGTLFEPRVFAQVVPVYTFPVYVEGHIPVSASTGDLVITGSGTITYQQTASVSGSYVYECDRATGECGKESSSYTINAKPAQPTAELTAGVTISPSVTVAFKGSIYGGLMWAKLGIKAAVPITLTVSATTDFESACASLLFNIKVEIYLVLGVGSVPINQEYVHDQLLWSKKTFRI
jgi:hypothetical protein